MATTKKNVVVAGGGMAGSMIAHLLESEFDVTLIDSKEFHEIRWASLRAMVDTKVADRIVIPHLEYLRSRSSKVIVGALKSCSETEVSMEDGTEVSFDYLIIATESKPESAIPFQDRVWHFYKLNKKIAAATTVLVVGGGRIGVEFAAEVATEFPDKEITLVHSGGRILEFLRPKASEMAQKWLERRGVTIVLDERVKVNLVEQSTGDSGTFFTSMGQKFETDFLFVAVGGRPHTSWLSRTIGSEIDENGRVKVDSLFRVGGLKNVFAIGDVTDIKEAKHGAFAHEHAKRCAANLKLLEKEGEESPLIKPYVPTPDVAIVSLGRSNGVAQLSSPLGTVTGIIPAMLRSRGLYVEKTRKDLGLNF